MNQPVTYLTNNLPAITRLTSLIKSGLAKYDESASQMDWQARGPAGHGKPVFQVPSLHLSFRVEVGRVTVWEAEKEEVTINTIAKSIPIGAASWDLEIAAFDAEKAANSPVFASI